MKISPKMKKALNDQVALEASASNNYLAMASWCEVTGYQGAADYFYTQSDEERVHMLKIVHYLNDMGAAADIPATPEPITAKSGFALISDFFNGLWVFTLSTADLTYSFAFSSAFSLSGVTHAICSLMLAI